MQPESFNASLVRGDTVNYQICKHLLYMHVTKAGGLIG
jgi:hypothetical protein